MNETENRVTMNESTKEGKKDQYNMPPHKHWCVNYFVIKGVGCGFVVDGNRHMTAQIYVDPFFFAKPSLKSANCPSPTL